MPGIVEGSFEFGLCCQSKFASYGFQEKRHVFGLFDFAFLARFPKQVDGFCGALFVVMSAQADGTAFVQTDAASVLTSAVLAHDTGDDLIETKHDFHSLN
jgi:hypothetical protein